MKNRILIIAIMTISFMGLSGCDSYLDKEYDASLSEEKVFNNATLTRQFLTNIYNSLPDGLSGFTDTQFLGASRDCMTDNASSFWGLHYYTKIANDQYIVTDHPLLGFWNTNFTAIRKCNQFLAKANPSVVTNAEVAGDDNKLYDRYCAEAKLMRAMFHFELVAYFGDAPILEDVILDMEDPDGMNLSRTDAAEVLKWVADQCDQVKDVLPFRYASEGNWGRVTGAAAYALKSRALLYRASALNNEANNAEWWQEAADAAKDFITKNDSQVKKHALYSDYQKCFYETPYNNDEIILCRSIWYTNAIETNLLPEGFSGCTGRTNPSQNFVDCFEMANGMAISEKGSGYKSSDPYTGRDPRFEAIVFHHGSVWGRADYNEERQVDVHFNTATNVGDDYRGAHGGTYTGYYLKKYVNPDLVMSDKKTFPHVWIIYRYAEILLNYAEALNEVSGATAEVYDAINQVRARAGMPELAAGLSKDDMRKKIRNERRIELSFEDHRFFDIRRWKLFDDGRTRDSEAAAEAADGFYDDCLLYLAGVDIQLAGTKVKYTYGEVTELGTRVFNAPKNYLFPIPYDETIKAPNLGQNPGWAVSSED